MKIICAEKVPLGDGHGYAGYIREEDFRAALASLPHLRPCQPYHGWAVKKTCVQCAHCARVILEGDEAPVKVRLGVEVERV